MGEIRQVQLQLSPEDQRDAEAIAAPCIIMWIIMSWIVADRFHQTSGQLTGLCGEVVLPLDLSKDFDPAPPYSHRLIINHMKLSCSEEKKDRERAFFIRKLHFQGLRVVYCLLSRRISIGSVLSLALINILINDLDDDRKRS